MLDNVSFKVYGNELVTIIGDNGAGKTTLIHLLIRIYDPTEGQILLNGKNLKNYSVESLYNLYGVLFQDYCNYETSARESITLTTETCSSDLLNFSLCASTADHFISELKEGIDTQLTRKYHENGIELSVGQKQRVALARAYYKNAPVIIFDEPSASIDPISEAEIYANIINQKGSKSIWLISHRLSTCVVSDRVLFLKDGKLIGNSSHDTLFKTNNEYKRMFMLQAEKYEVL